MRPYLNSSKQISAGRIAAILVHIRVVRGMTLFRPLNATDVFVFPKQQSIQLLFVLENVPFSYSTAREARVQS